MWKGLHAEGNYNALRFLYGLKCLWGERFQDMKIFMLKTLWLSLFPQRMLPPLWLGLCNPQPGGTLSKEHHPTLLPTLGTSAGRVPPSSWCQEGSLAAVTLSEVSSKGFIHTRERLGWVVLVFTAAVNWWSSVKQWEYREGLRPMDCSSMPRSRDNLNTIKHIKQMWAISIDIRTELSFPRNFFAPF